MKEKLASRIVFEMLLQFFSLFSSFVLAQNLDIELVGIMGFSRSIIGSFTIFVSIGLEAIYYQHNGDENFDYYFVNYALLKSILVFGSFFPLFLVIIFSDFEQMVYLIIIALASMISRFSVIFSTHLQSKLKIYKMDIPNFVLNIIQSFCIIFIAINLSLFSEPLIIIALLSITVVFLNIVSLMCFSKSEIKIFRLNKSLIIRLITETRPLIIAAALGIFASNLGGVLIDFFFGHEELAYYYIVNSYIISILLLISDSIVNIYISYFAKLFTQKKNQIIGEFAQKLERYSSILFLSIILVVLLNGNLAFHIFLPKYMNSVSFLHIMIFIPYLAAVSRPYGKQLYSGRRQDIIAKYAPIKSFVYIILMFIVIPSEFLSFKLLGWGAMGLCLLQVGKWFLDFIFYRYICRKHLNVFSYARLYLHPIIGGIVLVISFIFKTILAVTIQNDLILFVTSSFILLITYILLLILFKEINKNDLILMKELISFKSYKDSVLNEFK